MKTVHKLLGALTIGKGECLGRGRWRELKQAIKLPSPLKWTKTVP
jgi:hypothetical protein